MNNSFTKIQTIVLVIIAAVITWGGAVFQLRGGFGSFSGAPNIPGSISTGLPQTTGSGSSNALAPVPAALVRGILVEIKDAELSLKIDVAQGKFAEGTLRRATLTAKTKFVERTLKSSSELSNLMQKYVSDRAANPSKDIPFPKTYVSEREIAKEDLKKGDTLSVFTEDTSKEVVTADLVARITNP